MSSGEKVRVPARLDNTLTWLTRFAYLCLIALGFLYKDHLQSAVDITWIYLRSTWIFNSVYFETWWSSFLYPIILLVPMYIDRIPFFNRYKIDQKMRWTDEGVFRAIMEGLEYSTPLMLLDTFMVKKYAGVGIDPKEWQTRRTHWIQTTRALPVDPPTVSQIVIHLILSLIIYDLLFYLVHFTLHKNLWLYKTFHASHHQHDALHSKITNQLTVPERILLVLSANQALKFCHAHPLTRFIFVPLFLSWLVENHCGYDFPWTLDKVVPGGLVGGSPYHYAHHVDGSRSYQPFFTYIDTFMNNMSARRREKNKLC